MFHKLFLKIIGCSIIGLQVLLVPLAFCAPLDDLTSGIKDSLNITAAHLEIDNLQGIATYSGDVTLILGDRELKCDKLVIYRSQTEENTPSDAREESVEGIGGKIGRVIAYGKPVGYKGRVGDKPDIIRAYADIMEYDLEKQIFYLRDNARIEQGKNLYESPEIQYDLQSEIITSSPEKKGRIRMVIDAETLAGSTGDESLEGL